MPTPADHFAAFVDTLSWSPHTRIVRALVGESPKRFHGRVLLERAAHLVLRTEATLHDIAADSGFARYDVFARAFRREFGVLPSVWRTEPTAYVIDAPGDVHFHPPDGVRLPSRQRIDGTDLLVAMAEHHVRLVGDLVDRASLVTDGDLDRRSDGEDGEAGGRTGGGGAGTLRAALSRLLDEMEACNAVVRDHHPDDDTDPHDDPGVPLSGVVAEPESLDSMRRRLDRAGPELVDAVARLAAAGRFDETYVAAFTPAPRVLTFGGMVARVLTSADDRALAASRLRACGVVDPRPDLDLGLDPGPADARRRSDTSR